jgi:hypothetical protein
MVTTEITGTTLTPAQLSAFHEHGYLLVRGLFAPDELRLLLDTFMALHAGGPIPGCFNPVPAAEAGGDILKLYPRMMHPHRVNGVALRYLLDPRLAAILTDLFGEEPLAAQSMFYFKPAGARGQALHQDNFFLKVEPGTCIAAWVALDPADRENGGLEVVPGTHSMDIFCPEEADLDVSFTRHYVPVPPGLEAVPVDMEPGDVLFFNGSLVHGSNPNRTVDRFRRSFIGHYIGRSSERLSAWYRPILTMQGEEIEIAENTDGGPCGVEASGLH